ncbi:molybdenum cofactor biosynthesis protein B [Nitrosomonas sp.]|uniref:molybdenum cofactor biosynthesis protein B n=1 Tax=Nitrosomonas sp. TaxID=42353 RepID=UPI001DA7734F|nr:molybdenum cofactor biosynthesis protein B [Nitrosomonas sp.]MCB1950279.1 molybdenum cofactor biosynthesis protein B [Nitrosomonas sp.]
MTKNIQSEFIPLNIAVLTISDTRDVNTDKSGNFLAAAVSETGHSFRGKVIVKDNIYQIRAQLSLWIAAPEIHVVITTGGTGFSFHDVTPEAIKPLLDKEIPGFGEQFRTLSIKQVGSSSIQSRAFAGVANNTYLFSLPGSLNACKTGWQNILIEQLDNRHLPCNFSELLRQPPTS